MEQKEIKIQLPDNPTGGHVVIDDFRDAVSTDWEAMKKAIEKAREVKAARLVFSDRVYHLTDEAIAADPEEAQIMFRDLSNITIDGQGATLLFHHIKPLIQINNCRRLLVKDLHFDWDYDLACPGVVEKRDGKTYIRVLEGWDTEDRPLSGVAEYDFETWGWKLDGLEMGGIDGADMYYPDFSRQVDPGLYETKEFEMFHQGMTVIIRHYVYEAVGITIKGPESSDITFDSIKVYHNPGHAFLSDGCGKGLHFKNCIIGRKPNSNRLIANTADGIHLHECQGGIIVEDCDFAYQGDDSINFHGVWYRIKDLDGRHVTLERSRKGVPYLQAGGYLSFRKAGDLEKMADARIETLTVEGSTAHVVLERTLPESISEGDYAADNERTSGNFIIRNNHFHDHRARGMLIQAANGLIKGNVIENVMGAGIQITSDSSFWQEGYGAANILIEGNRIINVNRTSCSAYRMDRHPAAVNVVLDTDTGVGRLPFHEKIIFRNNEVIDSPGMAMFIASARDVIVEDNLFREIGYNVSPKASGTGEDRFEGIFMVTKSRDVRISGNRFEQINKEQGLFNIDDERTEDILLGDNEIIS